MGKIRTKDVKDIAKKLVELNPKDFSADFDKNKAAINKLKLETSKKKRNKIAGYVIRVVKNKKH